VLRQTIVSRTLISISAAAFVASVALAGDRLTIREIAPDTALLVLGADDFRGTTSRLESTAWGKLWSDPALADDVKKIKEGVEKGLAEAAAEVGVERDDISWPASFGAAVIADLDEELGIPSIQFMFFADWGVEDEKATKVVDAFLARAEKEAKDSGEAFKVEEIRGRRVLVSDFSDDPEAGADAMDGGDGMDEMEEFGAGPDIGPKSICLASDKGRLFIASSNSMMDSLLSRADGEKAKSFGETEIFRNAIDLAGGAQDIYAVLSTEAARPILAMSPQFAIAEPIIKRVFGDIKAWSLGVHARDGVLEQNIGLYAPEGKSGLLSLIDHSTEPAAPPSIVPSDAVGYGRMNVRFDRILPMIDDILGGIPPEMSEMIRPQVDPFRPAMAAAFSALGPEVHIYSAEMNPENPMAGTTVTAIAMKNDKDSASAVVDFINLLPMGLQSRDFNGMTILSDEFAPFAIGVGGGYLVIGDTQRVEQALRAVDAKGDAGLAGDADFDRSFSRMAKEPIAGFSWTDTARQIGSTAGMMQLAAGQMAAMGGLEEGAEAIPGIDFEPGDLFSILGKMTPEVAKRCFGDAILEFRATPKGFVTKWSQMPASGG